MGCLLCLYSGIYNRLLCQRMKIRAFVHSAGDKLQGAAELGLKLKGIYDAGKVVYGLVQPALPYIAAAMV